MAIVDVVEEYVSEWNEDMNWHSAPLVRGA